MKKLVAALFLFPVISLFAQNPDKPFIRLSGPVKDNNAVRNARQFLSGSTCRNCALTINGQPVKVYPTGAFAYEMRLEPGNTRVEIVAAANNTATRKEFLFQYTVPVPDTVRTLDIASLEMLPAGNLVLRAGDKISFRIKALPHCTAVANGNIPLYEMPTSATNVVPGIYQGEYTVQPSDSFSLTRIPVTLTDSAGHSVTRLTDSRVSMLNPLSPDIAITKGRLAHLLFGLGEDRLGGAKIGYIDSMIPLKITGKVGALYRVQLSKYRSAYIPDDVVDLQPKGTFTPGSLTGSWRIYGDSVFDYVELGLFSRLPYQSLQLINPSRIVVDVFGAVNNTNWITQLESVREVQNVYYEQVEDEVFRITIELKHHQSWGYQLYYRNNTLVVRVRRQPADLSLRNLVIAVDAGHGGANTGADGPTGSSEKMLALAVSLKLQKTLQQQGARVIMTRTTETYFDNKERILFYRDSLPDLLVSLHLNSSDDPVNIKGTSAYYRYIGFRPLSHDIYKRMLELGLKENGNTGSFNFMLNSPIEYPNALVEMLFLSNPEDEMKILDEKFQQDIADKIVQGIKDFLEESGK